MRVHFLRAAATAALLLLPLPARAEITPSVSTSRPRPAYLVIDQLIAQESLLSLDSTQVAKLTNLAERLRADKGRLSRVTGSRVPGKAVPRYGRVFPTSSEALRLALDLLTPEQRIVASRLLQGPERPKNHADMKEGNDSRG